MSGRVGRAAVALALATALAGCQSLVNGLSDARDETGVPPYTVPADEQGPNGLLKNGLMPTQPYD